MTTRVISQTIDLTSPTEAVSRYITRVGPEGIKIHPENWDGNTNYILINGNGFAFWDQSGQPVTKYGQDAIIGDENSFHIKITANYYFLSNDFSVVTGKTYYTRNGSGTEENPYTYAAVISPSGNPHTNNYYEKEPRLSFYRDSSNEVAYISGDKLYITQSVVLQQMDVGIQMSDNGLGQWSWKVHEANNANNLYLKWLG